MKSKSLFLVFLFIFSAASGYCASGEQQKATKDDPFGALYLWSEKEQRRSAEDITYRYYDYWAMRSRILADYYSAYRQWLHLKPTQRWLEDPEKNPIPPPPPLPPDSMYYFPAQPPWMPYFPYPYGYPYWVPTRPAPWLPPAHWQRPGHYHHHEGMKGGNNR